MLVTGPVGSLPLIDGGSAVLGNRAAHPAGLPGRARPAAFGHSPAPPGRQNDELAVLDEDGIELIPRAILRPLSRAAVRLMLMDGRGACRQGAAAMTFPRAALYLQIPASYCRSIGGLRWAHYGEAVEFLEGPAAGLTFAFAPEIALFLEGFRERWTGACPRSDTSCTCCT